jgi:hypothetical protein
MDIKVDVLQRSRVVENESDSKNERYQRHSGCQTEGTKRIDGITQMKVMGYTNGIKEQIAPGHHHTQPDKKMTQSSFCPPGTIYSHRFLLIAAVIHGSITDLLIIASESDRDGLFLPGDI